MLVRVMVLFQLVVLVIAGEVLSDDSRRFRGVATFHLRQEGNESFRNGPDDGASRRLQRRSTVVPPAPATRRRSTLQARAALRRRLAFRGAEAETLFMSETRNAHAGRLPPPDEETSKPPSAVEKDVSPSVTTGNKTVPRYVLRGRRTSTASPDTSDESGNSDDEEEPKERQRTRRPSKDSHTSDASDDDDDDDRSDNSSEKSGTTKHNESQGQKLTWKRRPGHEINSDGGKDKGQLDREARGKRSSTTLSPTVATSKAKPSNEVSSSPLPTKEEVGTEEVIKVTIPQVRRPPTSLNSTEDTVKAVEDEPPSHTALHKRRWPVEALSPPSSHAPFHPMLPAASALTMSDSLYNHFRPLSDVPEDHILPFLSFGKKLATKTVAVQRPVTGSTNSLLPDTAIGNGPLVWSLTTVPPDQGRKHHGSTKHQPSEDEVNEDMDVGLVKPAVERNKAARGGFTSAALRTLYSSQHRRLEFNNTSTTLSVRPASAVEPHAQNATEGFRISHTEDAGVDSNKDENVAVSSPAPTSAASSQPLASSTASSPSSVHSSVLAASRRRTETTPIPPSVTLVISDAANRNSTSARSEVTRTLFNSTLALARPRNKTTSNITANASVTGKSNTNITTTSSTTSYSDTTTTTTTTTRPSPPIDRSSSRWTIIVTMPPAVEETFPPPPRLNRRPINSNNYTRHFLKSSTIGPAFPSVPAVRSVSTSDTEFTPASDSDSVSITTTLESPSSENVSPVSASSATFSSHTYPSLVKVRVASTTSVTPVKDTFPLRPRNFSIYSTANRRPFLRKPPVKLVTATSSPSHRNNTEPPQFTNSVYVDSRQSPVPKTSSISWFPLPLEIPPKNISKLSTQRPPYKYQRTDFRTRTRSNLQDNEPSSTPDNTSEVADATTANVNRSQSYSAVESLHMNGTSKSVNSARANVPDEVAADVSLLGLSPPPPTTKILSTAVVTSVSVRGEWRSPVTTTLPPSLLPLPLELTADSGAVADIAVKLNTTELSPNIAQLSDTSSETTTVPSVTVQGRESNTTTASAAKDGLTTVSPVPQTSATVRTAHGMPTSPSTTSTGSTTVVHRYNSTTMEWNYHTITEHPVSSSRIVSTTQNYDTNPKFVDDVTTTPEISTQSVTSQVRNTKEKNTVTTTNVRDTTTDTRSEPVVPTIPSSKTSVEAAQPQETITLSTDTTTTVHTTPQKSVLATPEKEDQLPIVHLYNTSSTVWMAHDVVSAKAGEASTPQLDTAGTTTALRPNSSEHPGVQWDTGAPPLCAEHNDSNCREAGTPASGGDSSWGAQAGFYALGALCIVPLAVAAAYGVRYVARRRRKFLDESDTCSEISCPPRGLISRADKDIDGDTKAARLQPHMGWDHEGLPVTSWEVPRSKLRLQTVLGQGNFGQVLKAEIDDICGGIGSTRLVAVKTVKEEASQRDKDDLLREMEIMKMLGAHPNVVTLLGCCTEQEPHLLIMEYVMYGKLLAYLRDHRTRRKYFNFCEDDSDALTSRDLTVFAYCVARGMEYLAAKGIIHRDLAARNVLVDHNKMCKVADFGMSRSVRDLGDIYEQRHTKGALPIRWMAPESLLYRIFTHKSDVWSFGILIWEIVTLGSTPYPGQSAREVVRLVREGGRLERPPHCRPELFKLASRCWHHDPARRPSFGELKRELAALVEDTRFGGGYVDLDAFADHGYCYGRIPTAVRPSANTTADTTTTAEECDAEVISM